MADTEKQPANAGPTIDIAAATGRVSRSNLAKSLGVTSRTIWTWTRIGFHGLKLPCTFIGIRQWFTWEDVRAWQEKVRKLRLHEDDDGATVNRPRRRRATAAEADATLEKNGYSGT